MKFYLGGLGNYYSDWEKISKVIQEADNQNFDGVLIPDHYMWGERGGMRRQDSFSTLESWIALTWLAAKTEKINLGTLVTPLTFRPPGMLAKMLSTLDILSKGRVVLGCGAGWSKVEFDGYSKWDPDAVRLSKTEEALKIIIELWTKEKVDFNGRFYTIKGAVLEPKPLQKPYPTLLFGGTGKRMLNITGKYADIVYYPPWGDLDFEEVKNIVTESAKKAGRENKINFMLGSMGMGSPESTTKVENAVKKGATFYLVNFQRGDQYISEMKKFAEEIIPSFK
ncbi:LLM class flavin-dependent oxidoreductase [Candidatus Bathyarchaeota archaeon]|nr:LLM class flavin-dependent oxidoreductase [Candidatus Bathyarchaeota archaeon]